MYTIPSLARSALRAEEEKLCFLFFPCGEASFDSAVCRSLSPHRIVVPQAPWLQSEAPIPEGVEFWTEGMSRILGFDAVVGVAGEGDWEQALLMSGVIHSPLIGIIRRSVRGESVLPDRVCLSIAFGKAARVGWGLPPGESIQPGDWPEFSRRVFAFLQKRPTFDQKD